MKKLIFFSFICCIFIAACVKDRVTGPIVTPVVTTTGDSIIQYWDFNTDTSSLVSPTYSKVPGAGWTYTGAYYDTAQPGTTLNAIGADTVLTASSAALRLRNPASPGAFTINLPTTGYKNIVLKFAEQRTSKGSATNMIVYTTDGSTWVSTAIAGSNTYTVDTNTNFVLNSFDFSSDPNVNNNPKFAVRITFTDVAALNTSGNDRFDNITLYGVAQ